MIEKVHEESPGLDSILYILMGCELHRDILIVKTDWMGASLVAQSVVKNLPANAGGTGSNPWSGKIPYASEQLSPWATTI